MEPRKSAPGRGRRRTNGVKAAEEGSRWREPYSSPRSKSGACVQGGSPGTQEALTSPRSTPDGYRVNKPRTPAGGLALAGEQRASPARYGPAKATKRGRKGSRES